MICSGNELKTVQENVLKNASRKEKSGGGMKVE